ncbi:MAG TPA: hypothetical protein VNT30_21705 [Stellaceae bacterium]|nr:hypothetical protein [Stellaceae bacterium]
MVRSHRVLATLLATALLVPVLCDTAEAQTQLSSPNLAPGIAPRIVDPKPLVPAVPTLMQPALRPSVVSPQGLPSLTPSSSPLEQEKASIYRDQLRAQQNELQLNNAGRTIQGAERLRDLNTELNRVNQSLQP